VSRPTTLVCLPGMDGTAVLFRSLLRALPGWITPRLVVYPATGPNDYAALLPRVRAACEGLDDFFLLGWSFSGPLALRVAAEAPRGLRGVILCATFVRAPWPLVRWIRAVVRAPVARLFPLVSRVLTLGGGAESEELRRDKAESFRGVSPAALATRVRAALAVDARGALKACRVPLLCLRSTRDVVVPSWNAREIEREGHAVTVVDLVGAHLALRTNAAAGAEAIAKFIEGRDSA